MERTLFLVLFFVFWVLFVCLFVFSFCLGDKASSPTNENCLETTAQTWGCIREVKLNEASCRMNDGHTDFVECPIGIL